MGGRGAMLMVGLLLVVGCWPGRALARVERFAVVIGNDRGRVHEPPLRYAASDAERVYRVLRDLGGFSPVNMVLLRDEDQATVRSTLIAVNDRIREAVGIPGTDVLLVVYYSGHADQKELHLGEASLSIRELSQLVRGSAADFRLLVLDACRSGALTRAKGGRVVEPFDLPDARLPGDGLAFLTASSATEDAQESDELKSSFFTHALVTGMLGAADRDRDGEVALDEVYRYAYDATLRSTSRTLAGTQHPTFRYDFRGTGDLILTRPAAHRARRARLLFPDGMTFLVMRGDADGPVTAELPSVAPDRSLSLRPGRYFVRARGTRALYEGTFEVGAGTTFAIELSQLRRVAYAERGSKGGARARPTHRVEVGAHARTALPGDRGLCPGVFLGYAVDFSQVSVASRVGGCRSGFRNVYLDATTTAMDVRVRIDHAWRLSMVTARLGVGGGLSLLLQTFEGPSDVPGRHTVAPLLIAASGLAMRLASGFSLEVAVAAEAHFVSQQGSEERPAEMTATLAVRPSLSVAREF